MKVVQAFKDFISEEQRDELNRWTTENYTRDIFIDPRMDANSIRNTKLTTRFANSLVNYMNPFLENHDHDNFLASSNPNFKYPDVVHEIQSSIVRTFDFKDFGLSPVGKNGIITEISFEGGTIHPHTDPVWFEGTHTVHCNFITQKPESGGVTIINGEPWEVNDTDLLMYIVSSAEHQVDQIIGKTNRILWVFSFMLSEQDTQRIFS
tara:strand:+ start:783 stop:1403 length:621 start_codon:yes stop_codon:yes gene_type:complete